MHRPFMYLSLFMILLSPVSYGQEVAAGLGNARSVSEGARIDALKALIKAQGQIISDQAAQMGHVKTCANSNKLWNGSSCVAITTPAPPPSVSGCTNPTKSTPLYLGIVQNCNAGVVTTTPGHLNCSTQFIGNLLTCG